MYTYNVYCVCICDIYHLNEVFKSLLKVDLRVNRGCNIHKRLQRVREIYTGNI